MEGVGNRRKPQIIAENRRLSQIGVRHLRSVTFSSALVAMSPFKSLPSSYQTNSHHAHAMILLAKCSTLQWESLDGRNRAIVIAESLARVIAAIRIASVCWRSYLQGPLNGGVSNGGASRSGLVLPFLSFFVLFGTFPIFLGFS